MNIIHKNLKEASFILCQKGKKDPLVPKEVDWNTQLISYEEANKKLQEGYNIGLVGGVNDFFIIDCDKLELEIAVTELLPKSYMERSCSGGLHYIAKIKEKLDNLKVQDLKNHYGEIRSNRQYVVIAPSIAKNKQGNVGSYVVEKEVEEIPYVTKEQVQDVLIKFMKPKQKVEVSESAIQLLEKYNFHKTDKWFYELVKNNILVKEETGGNSILFKTTAILLEREVIPKEEQRVIAEAVANLTENRSLPALYGWIKKAKNNKLGEVNETEINNFIDRGNYPLTKYRACEVNTPEPLKLKQFDYFKNLKKPKMGIVEDLVPHKSLILTHSPPKHFKSLFELDKCICISSGSKFLSRFKTRKSPCLYIDLENSEYIIKDRWTKLRAFHGIKRLKTNLYYLGRDIRIDILSPTFISQVRDVIKKKKIKYIVIDTLPKASDYDTNSEREVNRIYSDFLKPLIEDYGCSINFLLHTNKSGTSWIGSQAYHGIVDCAYEFQKITNQKNRVKIISNNRGENIEFGVEFNFTDDEIKTFTFDVEKDLKVVPKAKFKELLECVKGLFTDETIRLRRKDIEDRLQANGIIIASEKEGGHYSRATLTRVLKFFVDNTTLENELGEYWLRNIE